jgi:hypothetical protein
MTLGLGDILNISQKIPNVPTNLKDILSNIPGIPPDIQCEISDIKEIQMYSKKIPTQATELNRIMNLPTNCTIVNIPKMMEFLKKYPDFKIPTQESIQDDVKGMRSCPDTKNYLKSKSDQMEEMLNIVTESNTCKTGPVLAAITPPVIAAIDYQTQSINNKIPDVNVQTSTYVEKTKYQMEMYSSVKFVNQLLLFFYVILFSVIHVLIFVQYVQGVKRDEIADTVWLTVFFLYPYLIYYVEKTIYSGVTYLLSLIYGKVYVYQFDKMFLFTDFYTDPGSNSNQPVSSL